MQNCTLKNIKPIRCLIAACTALTFSPVIPVTAEPGFDDTEYWNSKCGTSSVDYDEAGCSAFTEYMNGHSQTYQQAQQELETLKAEISTNLEEYGRQMDELNVRITELEEEIYQKESVINELQVQIDTKQSDINAQQQTFDSLSEEVSNCRKILGISEESIPRRSGLHKAEIPYSKIAQHTGRYTAAKEYRSLLDRFRSQNETLKTSWEELKAIQSQVYDEMISLQNDRDLLHIEEQKIEVIAQEKKKQQEELQAKQSSYSSAAKDFSSAITQTAESDHN